MFGLKNVVIRNLKNAVKDGKIDSKEDLKLYLDNMKNQLSSVEKELFDVFDLQSNCEHEFKRGAYTVQKRIADYVYVYERTCAKCYRTELEQHKYKVSNPFGIEQECDEKYYNNFI